MDAASAELAESGRLQTEIHRFINECNEKLAAWLRCTTGTPSDVRAPLVREQVSKDRGLVTGQLRNVLQLLSAKPHNATHRSRGLYIYLVRARAAAKTDM